MMIVQSLDRPMRISSEPSGDSWPAFVPLVIARCVALSDEASWPWLTLEAVAGVVRRIGGGATAGSAPGVSSGPAATAVFEDAADEASGCSFRTRLPKRSLRIE